MTDIPATLDEAMAIFQANLPSITKDEKATVKSDKGQYSYGYAGLDTVSEKVLRQLGALGVSWRTRPTLDEAGRFVLLYRLRHISGEEETGVWPLTGSTPQQQGSSITYARRYALMAVTGVFPAKEDDDGAAASTAYRDDDDWNAERPPTAAQFKLFDEYAAKIERAKNQNDIRLVGELVKDSRGHHRITHAQYNELGKLAVAKAEEVREPA